MLKNYKINTTKIIATNPSNLDQQAQEIVQKLRESILAHTNKEGLNNLNPSEDETSDVYRTILSAIKNGDGAKYKSAIENILSSRSKKVRFEKKYKQK